ncbi:Ccw14p Ecym_3268 [Eremothecium cymbalariae DBVPG|uniref:CFEM domain-containing protein n=1 Tax=Eremothecium cymbalariae (strain CBS 270.75 / DBVPG 7215 / KCTC 17166 / NRRL Y-17582) TaxID=931890 RepID=G8JRJ2_ERECY|nr:Hypothetical protein Ecym_3268 [Eremothecium cymbalariae DBVPG\
MRSSTFVTSVVLAIAVCVSEVIATPPACLLACVAQVSKSSTCGLGKVSCFCNDQSDAIENCLKSICPSGDSDTALSSFKSTCSEHGASSGSQSSASSTSTVSKTSSVSSASASSASASSASASSASASSTPVGSGSSILSSTLVASSSAVHSSKASESTFASTTLSSSIIQGSTTPGLPLQQSIAGAESLVAGYGVAGFLMIAGMLI